MKVQALAAAAALTVIVAISAIFSGIAAGGFGVNAPGGASASVDVNTGSTAGDPLQDDMSPVRVNLSGAGGPAVPTDASVRLSPDLVAPYDDDEYENREEHGDGEHEASGFTALKRFAAFIPRSLQISFRDDDDDEHERDVEDEERHEREEHDD